MPGSVETTQQLEITGQVMLNVVAVTVLIGLHYSGQVIGLPQTPPLAGEWQMLFSENCAGRYPPILRFDPQGVYSTPGSQGQGYRLDGGDWWQSSADTVEIGQPNDAMQRFHFTITQQNRLILRDEEGCVLFYQKAGD